MRKTMLKDFREHDASPGEGERDWMETHPVAILVRVIALAGIALAIGVSTSEALKGAERKPAPQPSSAAPHAPAAKEGT
jgi:hypothetical protein